MDRQDLDDFIADNLHELSWCKKLPIQEGAAGWCFLNALRDVGFAVYFKSSPYRVFYVFQYGDKAYELDASISFDEIITGWGYNPRACPNSLYDSIYTVIGRMQKHILGEPLDWVKISHELSEALCNDRTRKAHEARQFMEKYFLKFFGQYQEGMLKPIGKQQRLGQPRILSRLIETKVIDLDRINEAIRRWEFGEPEESFWCSNSYTTIAFLRDGKPLDDNHVVSHSNVSDYVWGTYLLELAEEKGYLIKKYELEDERMLEIAVDRGWNILEDLRK